MDSDVQYKLHQIKYMKFEISLEKIMFNIILFWPLIYVTTYMCGIHGKVTVFLSILMMIYMIKRITRRNLTKIFFMSLLLLLYVFVSISQYGVSYLINWDFYSYVLLILMFTFSINRKNEFKQFLAVSEKKIKYIVILSGIIILYSMIGMNGLRRGFGTSIPLLYGPFELPHDTAYLGLILYCLCTIINKEIKKKFFIVAKTIITIAVLWTAVRTTALALAILILTEYLSVKSNNKKLFIFILGGIAFGIILLNTDILRNNPLMQKTSDAIGRGDALNGRGRYIVWALKYFFTEADFIHKLIGSGLPKVREIMFYNSGLLLHAHNDVINILVGYGYLGLIISAITIIKVCRKYKSSILIFIFLMIMIWFNGLAMYTIITPCLPIIFYFFEVNPIERDKRRKSNKLLYYNRKGKND